jgi:serine/threonine-protein phosphatase PP1 catalytic subunit
LEIVHLPLHHFAPQLQAEAVCHDDFQRITPKSSCGFLNALFCVHGGLSPELNDLTQLANLTRPLEMPPRGLLSDLLWSDPDPEQADWAKSARGTSFTDGEMAVEKFLRKNDFDLICRAHQIVPGRYDFPFAPNQSVLTVFSAPGWYEEHGFVKGAMFKVDHALQCSFSVIEAYKSAGKKL